MSTSTAQDIRDLINNLIRGHGLVGQHTHRADDGGPIQTDMTIRHRNALVKPIETDSQILNENLNADLWRGHKITVGNTPPSDRGRGDVWVDTSLGYQAWLWRFWDGTQWAVNSVASVAWISITGKPSTFASDWNTMVNTPSTFPPSAHQLDGALHTVSGLTTGQVLTALSPTTFGFSTLPAGSPHNLLDGSTDQDTTATAVLRGMIIVGNGTPLWGGLALGSTGRILRSNGSDLAYSTASYPNTVNSGDLAYASALNTLAGLGIGTSGQYLRVSNSLPAWDSEIVVEAGAALPGFGTLGRLFERTSDNTVWFDTGSSWVQM